MIPGEAKNIKGGEKESRRFGVTLGVILLLWGVLFLWQKRAHYLYFFILSSLFISLAFVRPVALMPAQKALNFLVVFVGKAVTILLLCIVFYLVVTPIGLFFRLFGKDVLSLRINKKIDSYWIPRKSILSGRKEYERQF